MDRQIDRQIDRKIDRWIDRQIDRQIDRERERERERKRERERELRDTRIVMCSILDRWTDLSTGASFIAPYIFFQIGKNYLGL